MLSGEFTKKSDPQTFLVYPLAKLNEVEGYARAQQKVLLKVDIATGGEGPAMDRLVACKSGGSWIAIFSSDGAPLGHDFLRNVGREVVLPACTDLHADFRVWLLTSQAMDTLPALVARNCIQLAGLQSTAEHSSLASRELVAAVECGLLQKTRECLPLIAELRADEQVELFRKAGSEELCLGLLEGETAFVVTARDAQGASVLDVGIERRFYALVERVVQCRGKTDILDFDEMLKPENRRMLELLVDNHGQAFDVLMAVHKTATDGNYAVMRRLFEARVDVDFHYTSYPMATCIRNEYRDLTQLIIDRMEMVGFPPFRDPRIALHFLLALFVPVEQRAEGQRTAFTPHVLEMAARFAEASEGHHDIPWQFVEDLVLAYPDHPLIKQLLRLVDAEKDPANYFALFLKFDPHNEMTADCLRLYLQRIALTHGNVEQAKQRLLRDVIHRGDEVAVLTKILMDDGISPNYRLELPQSGGAALERTPVMHCLDPPGHPEALKMILRRPATDVNVGNEVKLNALQQCVVDMLNRPLPYVDHLDAYGTLFEDLLRAGADANVSPPAFYTSLFSYLAKLEFAPLCVALYHHTLGCNAILNTSENLLANMVNVCLDRCDAGLTDPEDALAVLDPRFTNPKPQDKWELWRSLVPVPDAVTGRVLGFAGPRDLCVFGRVSVRYYFLTLRHALWRGLCEAEGYAGATPALQPRLVSAKLEYVSRRTWQTPHLYFRTGEDEMTCAYTGEVLHKGGE